MDGPLYKDLYGALILFQSFGWSKNLLIRKILIATIIPFIQHSFVDVGVCQRVRVHVSVSVCLCVCSNFQSKQRALTSSAQIWPKMDLGLEIQKTNVAIRISILEIICMPIFRQNRQLWLFRPKFAQKWILGLEFQKSKSGFDISTSKIPCVPIFSENGQRLIFWTKFGEISQSHAICWF